MIWLQSNEVFNSLAQFDPGTGVLCAVDRLATQEVIPATPHGFFSRLGDTFLAVYGLSGKLYLIHGARVIEVGEQDVIEVRGPHTARLLRVVDSAGDVLTEVRYRLNDGEGQIPGDITPFIEDECFDIGLLASNISKNRARRKVFVNKPG